ncbi:MAG: glucokinase [Nitrospina sp.]|jgi:glucokinase|nr:glucokinase [Nitrospina sp.]MBT5632016.1 glucokinase [Nitrospina sp.]
MILAGDIGGTKTNLALFDNTTRIKEKRYISQDFTCIEKILDDFLEGNDCKIEKACFGVAGPVVNGKCSLTNLSWQIEASRLKEKLGVDSVWLINDLVAMASAIPILDSEYIEVIQSGTPVADGRISVISAGTGLGQAFLIPAGNGKYIVLDSEGGHCDFSPRNKLESELLFFLQKNYSRISLERVLSGPGLLDIYGFIRSVSNDGDSPGKFESIAYPASIVEKAIAKSSPVCEQTLQLFVSLYGALAGNLALQYLSNGGVYLAGGIAPKIVPLLQEGDFMEGFLSKGRFEKYLLEIPVKVVMDESAPLLGAAQYASTF